MAGEFEELEGELSELTKSVDGLSRNVGETQAAIVALSDEVTAIGDELPTKRELLAALLMAGSYAAGYEPGLFTDKQYAYDAVRGADALIAELAKPVDAKECA